MTDCVNSGGRKDEKGRPNGKKRHVVPSQTLDALHSRTTHPSSPTVMETMGTDRTGRVIRQIFPVHLVGVFNTVAGKRLRPGAPMI